MVEKLDNFQFKTPVGQSQFASLLDGSIWSIALDDFPSYATLNALRVSINNAARSRGLSLRTAIRDDRLVVQSYMKNGAVS